MTKYLFLALLLAGCTSEGVRQASEKPASKDSLAVVAVQKEELPAPLPAINDSLNAIAKLITGTCSDCPAYKAVTGSKHYTEFSAAFSKRWHEFDSTRIQQLKGFRENELAKEIKPEPNLFYPFSGPDILYAGLFFPDAEKIVMIGLEPVGTLPDFAAMKGDSVKRYYSQLNTSLNAILKFSFFRTESMNKDLKHSEVDGTIHLLLLFLNGTGNNLVSAKPVTIDSLGRKQYIDSFAALKKSNYKTKGVEIIFITPDNKVKELSYYSLNVVDIAMDSNRGFRTYLEGLRNFNTYLKGASYLLHKSYFSVVRNVILNGASTIVQDDSGIAYRYFAQNSDVWTYKLYGDYTRPISLFKNAYQKDLDSLYRKQGSTPLGFGIGYNFKDKNSNLMVAKRR